MAMSSSQSRASLHRSRWHATGARLQERAWRTKAIERGEIKSIFLPESKRLADDVRAMIDAAIAEGCVTKVPRGVSGIDYSS